MPLDSARRQRPGPSVARGLTRCSRRLCEDHRRNPRAFASIPDTISVESPAFADGGDIRDPFKADGERRLSVSRCCRRGRRPGRDHGRSGRPSVEPLVHLLAWDLPPHLRSIDEGLLFAAHMTRGRRDARAQFLSPSAYLPPDPPTGHSPLYAFQVFAPDRKLDFDQTPGRQAVVHAIRVPSWPRVCWSTPIARLSSPGATTALRRDGSALHTRAPALERVSRQSLTRTPQNRPQGARHQLCLAPRPHRRRTPGADRWRR